MSERSKLLLMYGVVDARGRLSMYSVDSGCDTGNKVGQLEAAARLICYFNLQQQRSNNKMGRMNDCKRKEEEIIMMGIMF